MILSPQRAARPQINEDVNADAHTVSMSGGLSDIAEATDASSTSSTNEAPHNTSSMPGMLSFVTCRASMLLLDCNEGPSTSILVLND